MSGSVEIVGSFADESGCTCAIERLRTANPIAVRVFSPIPSHHIEHAIGKRKSPVRAFVLTGGILGVISALTLTIGTSWEWNLVVGGKPIVSWPPFIVITFELMVLFGGISAVLGFLFNARVPAFEIDSRYSSRFSEDRFGLVVRCAEGDGARFETILRDAGAEDVGREAA
jgi:molybdopterin-containing oxidoreductase family membrane subunit